MALRGSALECGVRERRFRQTHDVLEPKPRCLPRWATSSCLKRELPTPRTIHRNIATTLSPVSQTRRICRRGLTVNHPAKAVLLRPALHDAAALCDAPDRMTALRLDESMLFVRWRKSAAASSWSAACVSAAFASITIYWNQDNARLLPYAAASKKAGEALLNAYGVVLSHPPGVLPRSSL